MRLSASKQIKILIAEDNPDLLELMADQLLHAGYSVVKSVDGQEAWDKIQRDDPDVLLLDLMMPKIDGFTLLEKVRNAPSKKYLPVIIISAKGELQDLKKGFSLQADHYITKPWEMNDILKGVAMVLKLADSRVTEN